MCSRASALAVLLACGCVDRALPVSPAASDLAIASDLSFVSGCLLEHIPVPLSSLATLDGSTSFRDSTPLRLLIGYGVRDCDLPADVSVVIPPSGGGVLVSVLAYEWLGSTSCSASIVQQRVLTIEGIPSGASSAMVEDGGPNATVASLFLTNLGTPPPCQARAVGQSCNSDCDCTSTLNAHCLVGSDGATSCGFPCNDDVDCASGYTEPGIPSCYGAPTYACGAKSCPGMLPCGFDEARVDCVCTRNPPPAGQASCSCSAPCPTGSICGVGGCVRPCTDDESCGACVDGACKPI